LTIYPDTSFLVSLYLVDRHTSRAQQKLIQRPAILFTQFHRAELTHATYQHVFRGQISEAEARLAIANVDRDCRANILSEIALPATAFETCADLAKRHVATLGVRTLDSLHVAAALELKADRFWTFDERQGRLAEAEGLTTN